MEAKHTLVTCIVNKGLAETVMETAREAGATGGTILPARGTGKEEDVTFFGVTLVPEKEMLLIITSEDQTDTVLAAIQKLPSLEQPGSGIAFCVDAQRFTTFG